MPEICRRAQIHGQRIAAVDPTGRYTFEALYQEAVKVASGLLALEGGNDLKEARIAYLIPGGAEYIVVQWGIWLAGGIAVPVSLHHPLPAIRYVLEDTGASQMIVADTTEPKLVEGIREIFPQIKTTAEAKAAAKEIELPEVARDSAAMILYTSGTTSLPKGVVSTHEGLRAQITTLVDAWQWSADDQIVCVLPLHHVHGIVNVMSCALWSGACVHFLPKFSPAAVFEIFEKESISLFMAVPTIYFKLIAYYESLPPEQQKTITERLKEFRLMVSGSAALPVSVLEQWQGISGQTLLERYGMTEIGMAISNPYAGERRPGYIGQPLPGVAIRLVDEAGAPVPAAEGMQGEIQVKGPAVFREYWQKPAATEEAFTTEGWFKTGDVAAFERGSYRILGRTSIDIIKSGGYKISALEIEEVLRTHPAVKDCGVIGLPDEEWGEVVAVCLVPEGEKIDETAFSKWMRAQLPAYRVPRKIIQRDDLPRNALGKVTKNELKQYF